MNFIVYTFSKIRHAIKNPNPENEKLWGQDSIGDQGVSDELVAISGIGSNPTSDLGSGMNV